MAQDFRAAFGLGDDDKHISSLDEDGIALAAIKALHRDNGALSRDDRALERDDAQLRHDDAELRRNDAQLRRDHAQLRRDDEQLRRNDEDLRERVDAISRESVRARTRFAASEAVMRAQLRALQAAVAAVQRR
jgi:predicted  nucleic acid-binding Zn-ribbon protein